MADKMDRAAEAAEKEASQVKFFKCLTELLKEHRDILHFLPEMFERFTEMEWNMPTEVDTHNFDTSRQDELNVLTKRKQADLLRFYKQESTKKDTRIASLERELEQKDRESALIKEEFSKKEEELTRTSDYSKILEQFKSRNDELIKEIEDKEEKIKECSERIASLERELEQKDRESALIKEEKDEQVKKLTERNEFLENELQEKDQEIGQMNKGCKEIKDKCQNLLMRKGEELSKVKDRLAYLSEKQVKKDQRQVEDTTASNRPSEVEKDFAAFVDEDRMDAREKMQQIYGSEEEKDVGIYYPRLACMIFETTYEQMKEIRAAVFELFKDITKSMITSAPKMGQEFTSRKESGRLPYQVTLGATGCSQEFECSTDVLDALMLSLKETSHTCNLESLEKGVTRKVKEKWLNWIINETSCTLSMSDYLLSELSDYIKACIRLTWRMVTQVPPMQLEYQSSVLRDIHKNIGYHSSPEMSSARPPPNVQDLAGELNIACYLWPGLLDGGGKLIRAGEVLCKFEEVTMI